jgi:hypothetical protein
MKFLSGRKANNVKPVIPKNNPTNATPFAGLKAHDCRGCAGPRHCGERFPRNHFF